ncbi:MAG: hypothetical protein NWF06_00875 [Candidatus Bathyarchaeota archaeon]|nr:hypothetical protein [Candidatus Bathyarchaeum sp.]
MGERTRNTGNEAENKAWGFLRNLGYNIIELNNEEYNIDCFAEFVPRITKFNLVKPRYSPDGLTAFEVTEETLTVAKINNFRNKIDRYNADNPEDIINGGVLLINQKIGITRMNSMREQNIWGWGFNRQRLYQEKLRTFNQWNEIYGRTEEVIVDTAISYLRCSTPPPTKRDKLFYISLFLDDSNHRLSTRKLGETMNVLKRDFLQPLLDLGILPINIHFECHSLGGKGELEADFNSQIIDEWRKEGINIMAPKNAFKNYRTFAAID